MNTQFWIGQAISHLRKEKKFNTYDLAQLTGLSQASISLYQHGKRNPSKGSLMKIASALDSTIDEIILLSLELQQLDNMQTSESRDLLKRQSAINKQKIKAESDLIIELTEDFILSGKFRIHSLASEKAMPLSQEGRSSMELLLEKVFIDLIRDKSEDIHNLLEQEAAKIAAQTNDFLQLFKQKD